jgi:dynein heavy chain, axonemal
LNKIFDNIARLEYDPEVHNQPIKGMQSAEGEQVEFKRPTPIPTKNVAVEVWMEAVKEEMISTLGKLFKAAHTELEREMVGRTEWVLKHVGQVVSVISLVSWTSEVENAIADMEEMRYAKPLVELHQMQIEKLTQLVSLIRNPHLESVKRKILSALIT